MDSKKRSEEAGVDLPEQPDLEILAEQLARAYEEAGIELPSAESNTRETGSAGTDNTPGSPEADPSPLPSGDDPTVEELLDLVVDFGVPERDEAAARGSRVEEPGGTALLDNAADASAGQRVGRTAEETAPPLAEPETAAPEEEYDDLECLEAQEVAEPWAEAEDPVELVTIVEALLFVGAKPIKPEDVAAKLPGTRADEVERAVVSLARRYARQARPYRIVRTSKGYVVRVLPEFARVHWARPGRKRPAQLSPAALEVLAIIAYRQPVSVDEIDKLRSARSAGLLKQLLARRLVEPVPGSEHRKGKTRYRTTARFLQVFRLASLGDLPRPDFAAATELQPSSPRS